MTARLEYLEELSCLDPKDGFSKKYAEVEKEANKIRIVVLKYMSTKNNMCLDRVISYLQIVCEVELNILVAVCNTLRTSSQGSVGISNVQEVSSGR
jgi:hypothetical protein